jgi:post-segregation antitoxin (ccd killing protein)
MNVNLYLPDDLGRKAKDGKLPLSQLLREAVAAALERRDAMKATLEGAEEQTIVFEDAEGRSIRGRFTGSLICEEQRDGTQVYLTDDERVILYEPEKARYWELDDPENDLQDVLDEGSYVDAMTALGIDPVVDI